MKGKKLISLLMVLMMTFTCVLPATTALAISDFEAPDRLILTSMSDYNIAPGITQHNIVTRDKETGNQTKNYVAKIDASVLYGENKSAGFLAGYSDYSMEPGKWDMMTVRDQVAACEEKTGKNIVFAMNGDYFNMQTGRPSGALVMNGKVLTEGHTEAGYFALLKDGTFVLRDGSVPLDDVQEAVGSPIWLVRDGAVVIGSDGDCNPRGAVGITEDGSLVFFECDGRQAPYSVGQDLNSVANIMLNLGCVNALYLDGGGSATFTSKLEGTDTLELRNSPSDGTERKVSSSIFIYSDAKSTGEFHHASLSPVDELYTPGSSVTFSAIGVDSAGGKAELPEDGNFILAEDSASLGTITPEGVFTSNGTPGTVTVNYVSGGAICGETSVGIVIPDTLFVGNTEQAVGPGSTTDFGIVAKYQNRDVAMKDGDLAWSIVTQQTVQILGEDGKPLLNEDGTPMTEIKETDVNGVAGTFSGLTFTAAEDGAYNTIVRVNYVSDPSIKLELTVFIGSKQVSHYDFEYTDDLEEAEASGGALKYIPSLTLPTYGAAWLSSNINPETGEKYNNTTISQKLYAEGVPLYMWPNGAVANDTVTATIVSKAEGEPVRMGEKALRISFDFSTYNYSSNANFYLRGTAPEYDFEGSPTAIGAWVYAPEGTAGYALYLQCDNNTGATSYQPVAKADKISDWKYVEFDLTGTKLDAEGNSLGGQKVGSTYAPFGHYQGNGVFWISYQPGSMGKPTADTLYLDDIKLIYGANTSDTTNPVIKHIGGIVDPIEDGVTVYNTNTNTFKASYADAEDKYMTGIDDTKTRMLIDGVDVTSMCYIDEGNDEIYFYDAYLANGVHAITIEAYDVFGNKTSETRYFTVAGEGKETELYIEKINDPVLGEDYILAIKANNPADVLAIDAEIHVNSSYRKYWRDVTVEPADGYQLAGEANYNEIKDTLSFKVEKKAVSLASNDDGVIALIKTAVPSDTPESLEIKHSVIKGAVTYASAKAEKYIGGFSGEIESNCKAAFTIIPDRMIVGSQGGNIYVTDVEGNKVEGVNIYDITDTTAPIGTTDAEGKIFTDRYVDAVKNYTLFAVKGDQRSFNLKSQSFLSGGNADGTPSNVKVNATVDPETQQSISWMASPLTAGDDAIVKYALKSDYEAAGETTVFSEQLGESHIAAIDASGDINTNYAVRFNNALLTGLKAESEYVYMVGDGVNWSAVKAFKTDKKGTATNFFVIGDTQSSDISNPVAIFTKLAESGVEYDFGIQTGDAVDNGGNYAYWEGIGKAFSGDFIGETDMVHVLGNHEYTGNPSGSHAAHYFNIPGTVDGAPAAYSVQYGNVYVAAINYASNDIYKEAAEWIKSDAANSTAQWKVLTIHEPPYYTNVGAGSAADTAVISALVDEVGIDFVFASHDHSYARTYPITAGQQAENGAVYYICAATSPEKGYQLTPMEGIHEIATNDYNSVYLTVSADDKSFKVTTWDYKADGTHEEIDSYTKTAVNECATKGHSYLYNNDGYLVCDNCAYTIKMEGYRGLVKDDATRSTMYIDGGVVLRNSWLTLDTDVYYFDANGFAKTGTTTVPTKTEAGDNTPVEYTFDENGKYVKGSFVKEIVKDAPVRKPNAYVYTDDNGHNPKADREVVRYYEAGGTYATRWRNIDGNWYYFFKWGNANAVDDGDMYRGGCVMFVRTPGKNSTRGYFFETSGIMTSGAFESDYVESTGEYIGTRYYWANEYVTDTRVIDGVTYEFDKTNGYLIEKNLGSSTRITIDKVNSEYNGNKFTPKVTVKCGDELLKKGTHYTVEYVDTDKAGEGYVIITGKPDRGFEGKVEISLNVKAKHIKDLSVSSISTLICTGKEQKPGLTIKNGSVVLKEGTDYTLTYKNNTAVGKATVTIKGIGSYYGEKTVSFKIIPDAAKVKVTSKKNSITLTWNKVEGATGYRIYRYENKKWTVVEDVTGTSYTFSKLTAGKKYTYSVKPFGKSEGTNYYAATGSRAYTATKTVAPKVTVTQTTSSITLKWNKVAGATGYRIYRYDGKSWKTVKTISGTSYTFKSLKAGTKYTYSVKPYIKTADGSIIWGETKRVYTATKTLAPKISATTAKTSVTLKWEKVAGASGYEIYRSTSKSGKYTKVGTASAGATKYTNKSLKSGTTYYYKVRAYKTVDSVKIYSSYSSALKAVTLK